MISRIVVLQVIAAIALAAFIWLWLATAQSIGQEAGRLVSDGRSGQLVYSMQPKPTPHTHDGGVGEFYQTWRKPNERDFTGKRITTCCNTMDCEAPEIITRAGQLYVRNHKMMPGRDVLLPDKLMEHNQPDPRESPDGRTHVCANHTGVLCVVLGSGT